MQARTATEVAVALTADEKCGAGRLDSSVMLSPQGRGRRQSLARNDGNLLVRRPSSSVNLLQKTLPSLVRNATFPLVGKARARGAENKVQRFIKQEITCQCP
jgi:hypothetical protein